MYEARRNDDEYNEQVLDMSRVVDKVFDSILTLNPSFFRAEKSKVHKHLIEKWKKYDFSDDLYPKTIVDQAQGGSLELNYTYCNDRFFWTPFVYDIALIFTSSFEVKDPTDLNSWEEPKTNMFTQQLMYETYDVFSSSDELVLPPFVSFEHLVSDSFSYVLFYELLHTF